MVDKSMNAEMFRKVSDEVNSKKAEELLDTVMSKCMEGIKVEAEKGRYVYDVSEKHYPELFSQTNYQRKLQMGFQKEMESRGFKVDIHDSREEWENLHWVISWVPC